MDVRPPMSATAELGASTSFPFGYTPDASGVAGLGRMLTFDELERQDTWRKLHPEVKRRAAAMMAAAAAAGVPLGVGTGWRSFATQLAGYRRDPRRFARPGNSNHEGFTANGNGDRDAVAADMVPNSSWAWMEENCGRFGLRTFRAVNHEPWHIQPIEIPASRKGRTVRWDLPTWVLPVDTPVPPVLQPVPPIVEPLPPVADAPAPPDDTPPAPPTPIVIPPAQPTIERDLIPMNKTVLHPDLRAQLAGNGDVRLVQVLALGLYKLTGNATFDVGPVDGDYGPRTQAAVRVMQGLGGVEIDGVVGPQSWAVFLNADGT